MEAVQLLSQEQLERFEEDGFLHLPGAISPSEVLLLEEIGDGLLRTGTVRCRERGYDGYEGIRDCFNQDERFRFIIAPDSVLPGVVQLLGGNIRIISSLFVYKHPLDPLGQRTIRTPEMTGWHRDMREVVRDLGHECIERYSVMASYFLSDLRVEGLGSSLFVRGSHRLREALYVPPDRADPEECVSIPVEPGDAILFENRTWHAGQLNTSKRDDKILFIQYAYRWLAPVDYWNVNPELASQLTDIESQLLGLTTDVDRGGNFVLGSGSAAIEKWAASAGIEPRHHPYYGPRR